MKKINKKTIIFLAGVSLALVLFVGTALASDYGLEATRSASGLSKGEIPTIIGYIVGALLSMIGVLFFGLMLYGGIIWMTARGNQENEKKALGTITAAIIGIIIVIASYAITNFVFKQVLDGKGASNLGTQGDTYSCECSIIDKSDAVSGPNPIGGIEKEHCTVLNDVNFQFWETSTVSKCFWSADDSCTCTKNGKNYTDYDMEKPECSLMGVLLPIGNDNEIKGYQGCEWKKQ